MHPDISAFPSATFYDGRLLDGNDMAGLRQREWHSSSILAPYRFFDVQGQHEAAPKGHSLVNRAEINVAVSLYKRLMEDFRQYNFNNKIGIITPYKSQLRLLKETFSNIYGSSITDVVEFNTTDAFQGRESEIIIFSCVRASPAGNIGFLQDIRRMNVGLTRAKCSLWVLGNSQSLARGQFWKKLVEDARERDLYTTGDLQSILRQPSSKFPAMPRTDKPRPLPAPAKGSPTPASHNTTAIKQTNGTRIINSKAPDLAMFKTGPEPLRKFSNPPVGDPRRKQDVKIEVKVETLDEKQTIKRERKDEQTYRDSGEDRSKLSVQQALEMMETNQDFKTEVKPAQDEIDPRSRTATPGSVSATESRGSSTPGGRPNQPPPGRAIKRKAASSNIFMQNKKKR